MASSGVSLVGRFRQWRLAAETAPKLAIGAFRHGLMPAGFSTAKTVRQEGVHDLHWKILGDGLVRFFQNSGPVLTKFGQVLATRHDLLPAAVCARLEALYSKQPPMSHRQLKQALKHAYGRKPPFRKLDPRPVAVGSIGQVHRARLRRGKPVIVKILRPGVEEQIERDLNLARVGLSLLLGLSQRGRSGTRFLLTKSLEDLAAGYAREVDFRQEADSLQEFRRRFEKNPNVVVPQCYDHLSSKNILVMEELVGEPISVYRARSRSDPRAAKKIADLALTEVLRQIFEDGRFHADPHGGNLLILKDGRLGIIDLGLTGEFSRNDRKNMARAVRAFLSRDVDALIRSLLEFGTTPPDFNLQGFQQDVMGVVQARKKGLVSRLKGDEEDRSQEASSNSLEGFATALFNVAHHHRVYVPPSTTLFIKTLVTIEGVARSLNPELNLVTVALPVVLRSLFPRWMRWMLGPKGWGARLGPAEKAGWEGSQTPTAA